MSRFSLHTFIGFNVQPSKKKPRCCFASVSIMVSNRKYSG